MFGLARQRAVGAKIRDVIIPDRLRAAHDAGMARYLYWGQPHPQQADRGHGAAR
jgi:two-component system NtrC family sensor kinase